MSKKKILITTSTFPRWVGDTEPRFILDYAKALNEYYNVTVLAPSAPDTKTQEALEGVNVIRYRYFPIKKWENLCYPGAIVPRIRQKKIRALLVPFLMTSLYFNIIKHAKNADLVHSQWFIPQGILQSFINKPYIITGHGTDVTTLNKSIFRTLKKHAALKAKHVVTVSERLKNIIKDFSGITEEKVSIIPMGCNTKAFGQTHRKENFFEQGDRKVVLFTGRLVEVKGVEYLIEAVKNLDVLLVIVGSGPLQESLQKQAEPIADKVQFLGSKTHDELKTIYASADMFVAPSITASDGSQEGFGLVIIEAMASGLPVIASHSGGIVDIIQHEENGLLCPEKDIRQIAKNIVRLSTDTDCYKKLQKNGYETALKYDYSEIAKQYKEIIDDAIS